MKKFYILKDQEKRISNKCKIYDSFLISAFLFVISFLLSSLLFCISKRNEELTEDSNSTSIILHLPYLPGDNRAGKGGVYQVEAEVFARAPSPKTSTVVSDESCEEGSLGRTRSTRRCVSCGKTVYTSGVTTGGALKMEDPHFQL